MAMLNFNITPFAESEDGPSCTRWEAWKEQFVAYLSLKGVEDRDDMFRALMCFGGPDVRKVAQNVSVNEDSVLDNRYRAAMEALDNYYSPRMSERYERFKFRQILFKPNEKLDQFVLRLRTQATQCNFADQADSMIMDQIVFATQNDDKLRAKYLEADSSLEDMLTTGRTYESVRSQVQELRGKSVPAMELNAVNNSRHKTYACSRCLGNHRSGDKCPALNSRCRKCGKPGHFARCCRGSRSGPLPFYHRNKEVGDEKYRDGKQDRKPKFVREVDDVTKSVEIRELFHLEGKRTITAAVGGVEIRFIVDTGADEDILSEEDWKMLKRVGFEAFDVRKGSTKVFRAYGSQKPLTVLGEVEAHVVIGKESCATTLFVIQDGKHSLLSGKSAEKLGVVKFLHTLLDGALPFIKDVCASIKIDPSIPPVMQAYRRIPIPLEELTILKLKELEAQDVIERVHEASEWVSPMLVKRKSQNEVRLIIDLREANKAIVREVHPLPTLEQMACRLKGSTVFAKLDIKQAFYQLKLREDCRYITTFISPLGLMRYKRLVFGLSAAPELFQKCMETILSDFPWVVIFIDDILIHAQNMGILKQRIVIVRNRLSERNVILNEAKTVECVHEIQFLGYHLSAQGVKVSSDKIEAITKFRQPKTAEEVRSFLGLVTFVNRYIPNLSTIAYPLNMLTKKTIKFEWADSHQKAFEQLKTILTKNETLAYFDPSLETFLVADASPIGLGAVLYQKSEEGTHKVISFASKTLSDVERRYAQTEREALALVWAPEKFHHYLYGKFFWLITDHKPLVTIFGDRTKPCARIERWKLRLMSYDYRVIYRAGKSNIADPFSRLCQDESPDSECYDEESERIVRFVSDDVCPVAVALTEIKEATVNDIELAELIKWLPYPPKRWPKTLIRYKLVANDLSTDGAILLKNKKIIIPRVLQPRILKLAHEPHLGSDAMKKRLREKVWWVRIDAMAENFVKACNGCLLVSEPKVEPMVRTPLPDRPWQKLAIDFTEVSNGIHLLVVVDYYSRFPEIEILTSTTAKSTIFKLRMIFARYGFPEQLVCDNGPPFASDEFIDFCRKCGIDIKHSVPYAPFQNGLVERYNRTLLKTIKISVAMGRDWKNDLYDFLLAYRNTPHSVTNVTPSKLLFGHNLRDKLPETPVDKSYKTGTNLELYDKEKKEKGKIYGDQRRKAKHSLIDVGDHVVVKNVVKRNKLTTNFNPQPHVVVKKNGSRITVKNLATGAEADRHVNHAKQLICNNPFKESPNSILEPQLEESNENPEQTATENLTGMPLFGPSRKRSNREVHKPNYLREYQLYRCNKFN